MNSIEPDHIIRVVRELHGYELDAAGAARCAEMLAAVALAVVALAPDTQFHEEPATLTSTLAALAPKDE